MKKTKVYNLVILDKSKSMDYVREAAIDGFNEVLKGITQSQERYRRTQEQFVSLVVFSGTDIRVIYDGVPVWQAAPLMNNDYSPFGMTPLYDAIGLSLTRMEHKTREEDDVAVVVTIITDGLENASREYDRQSIAQLIGEMKEKGWAFTLMGANQDSAFTASQMGIRNSSDFDFDSHGLRRAFVETRKWTQRFSSRLHRFKEDERYCMQAPEERAKTYREMADEVFDNMKTE